VRGGRFGVNEPRIERRLTLQFQGDWGQANLHRICGWLAQEVLERTGEGTRIGIWTGRGGADAVRALKAGIVDLSLLVPAYFTRMAVNGTGLFEGEAYPGLRALGTFPQTDRLIVAVAAEHGVTTMADLRERCPALRIATSPNDGVNAIGFTVDAVLVAHGLSRELLEQRGCTFLVHERPHPCLAWLRDGVADAVIQEAIMTPAWWDAAEARNLSFVPLEDDALSRLEADGFPPASVPAGYLRGLDVDLLTLDYSDFIMLCRDDLPDDVASLLAWCMIETRSNLERQYRHLPPERSAITYPIDPVKVATVSIALHPGAARCYEELLS
jgi:TRAP-type uncharacterized transport system substrate-binding protein